MSVKIRLKRVGGKKQPFYRIVVTDSRNATSGKVIEELGSYNPKSVEESLIVDREKAEQWIDNGARPSEVVRSLLRKAKAAEAEAEENEETENEASESETESETEEETSESETESEEIEEENSDNVKEKE